MTMSVQIVYRRLLNSSSNDGEIVAAAVRTAIGDKYGWCLWSSGGCVENFFEELVPFFTVSSFRSHFRMNYSMLQVKVQVSYSCILISYLGVKCEIIKLNVMYHTVISPILIKLNWYFMVFQYTTLQIKLWVAYTWCSS